MTKTKLVPIFSYDTLYTIKILITVEAAIASKR